MTAVVTFLAILGLALIPAPAAAVSGVAHFSGAVTTDDGTPLAGARVLITDRFEIGPGDFADGAFDASAERGSAATTDAAGHYDAPNVPADEAERGLWVVASAPGRGLLWHRFSPGSSHEPFSTRAGDRHYAFVRYPAGGGVLRGTVGVRDGRSAERAELIVSAPNAQHAVIAHAAPDGSFEMAVPGGPQHLRVTSRFGIDRLWPGIPLSWSTDGARSLDASGGQRIDLGTVVLPARLRYDAVDEYGSLERGVDGPAPDGTVGEYPFDQVRPPGRIVGPRLTVGRVVGLSFPGVPPTDELTTMTGLPRLGTLTLTNTGDDDVQMSAPRFEGPDAALFSCRRSTMDAGCGRLALQPLFEPDGGPRAGGSPFNFELYLDATTYRNVYRATMVFDTNTALGTVRVPLNVRNRLPPGIQANQLPSIADTPKAIADIVAATERLGRALGASVRLARSAVRITLPGAGTARVQIDRRSTVRKAGKARRTWTPARTLRITTKRRATVTRKVRPLAKGTYRLRVRTTIKGRKTHTKTTVRTIRN